MQMQVAQYINPRYGHPDLQDYFSHYFLKCGLVDYNFNINFLITTKPLACCNYIGFNLGGNN